MGRFIKFLAVVLAIVSFCMMFADQVQYVVENSITGPIASYFTMQEVMFGKELGVNGSTLVFISYLLIGISATLLLFTGFFNLKKGFNAFLSTICILMMLFGGITVFFTKDLFINAQTSELIKKGLEMLPLENTAGPITAGILAIVSSFFILISIPLTNKK